MAAERLAVQVPRALRPQALQVLRAERGGPHEATAGGDPEAPELLADAAVVAAAFN